MLQDIFQFFIGLKQLHLARKFHCEVNRLLLVSELKLELAHSSALLEHVLLDA